LWGSGIAGNIRDHMEFDTSDILFLVLVLSLVIVMINNGGGGGRRAPVRVY
jgi:hypothetical protein